ncbi:MAG: 2-dehydropantoate 2-reductase [Methanomicrobiaceae archaeon]|nr:2-dehydropantoate 2-reductase [Methanomicrobiaceae archaeon]
MSEYKPEILIIGAGAVGLSIAGKLSDNSRVSVICRKRHRDAINSNGLLMKGVWGDKKICNLNCFSSSEEVIESGKKFNFILITAKSTDTEHICNEFLEILKNSTVISIQNGIGNEDILNQYSNLVLGATITTNFRITADGAVIIQSESEPMKIGLYPDNSYEGENNSFILKNIVQIINKSGIQAEECNDIRSAIWEKSLLNIAVNPITALFSISVGETLDENLKATISGIINEVYSVVNAEKIRVRWNSPEKYLDYLFNYLIPSFSNVYTSMYQDIEMKRLTEIDFINGAVVKLGEKHGIQTPFNSCICSFIKFREKTGLLSHRMPDK